MGDPAVVGQMVVAGAALVGAGYGWWRVITPAWRRAMDALDEFEGRRRWPGQPERGSVPARLDRIEESLVRLSDTVDEILHRLPYAPDPDRDGDHT